MVNTFLLTGDKCTPKIHLTQLGFTYSAYELSTKTKERIKKIKKQLIQDTFTKINLIKLAFSMI